MDVDEPTAKAVGGEILPMIFVVSKAIEYIKNQILDRVVSRVTSSHILVLARMTYDTTHPVLYVFLVSARLFPFSRETCAEGACVR